MKGREAEGPWKEGLKVPCFILAYPSENVVFDGHATKNEMASYIKPVHKNEQ